MSQRVLRNGLSASKLLLGSLLLSCAAAPAGYVSAATQVERKQAAAELVSEALHREIYGLQTDRQELLDEALQQVPGYAPAMWHRGYVRYQNQWVKAVDLPQVAADDPRLAAYLKIRDNYAETVADQMALADWCRRRGLSEQERAHLATVIGLENDHADARRRLGFRRIDGQWVSEIELAEAAQQLVDERKSLDAWRSKLESIRQGLHHRSELQRKNAQAQLLEIRDAGAVSALELMLSRDSEDTARMVVETLGNMPQHQASLALARQAIYSPWQKVRQAAAMKLKTRPEDHFVPPLLATLYTPLVSNVAVFRVPGGQLGYRHSFYREGQKERELLVLDTAYRRVAFGGDGDETLGRALVGVRGTIVSREVSVEQQNRRTKELNDRISAALNTATGQNRPANPESWWQWWNEQNEVFVTGQKQMRTVHQAEQVAVVDQIAIAPGQQPKDCLAAGTLVWTALGKMPIEEVRVGDLVLAQDPQSGELAFKPVLQTTVRPKSSLIKIRAGEETIETSGGHLFWVAGEGWVRARKLASGMELHGVAATIRVISVDEDREEQTYNMIVADFNTYFVGESKILCHDNTVREPTNAIVPGLIER